jgi:tripartite-type tricarboxylate transporter receptor subunit TctC
MKLPRRKFLHLAAGAATLPAFSRIARAQVYPARPVRMIVAFAPGGPTDLFGRLIAQRLSDRFRRQFYIDNVVGGAGNIATAQAARSAPDGHTILLNVSAFVTNPAFLGTAPYDPVKDFAPVAVPVASAIAIVVHPSVPMKTVRDLVAVTKANPGKYSYATGGAGAQPHLTFEQFRLEFGLDLVHVPFPGAGPAVAAVVAGHVPIAMTSWPTAVEQVLDAKLRALALTSRMRSKKLPDIPTGVEAGYPMLQGDQWVGLWVPAGTPKEIVTALHTAIIELVGHADLRERLEALDFYQIDSTPLQFGERIKTELENWRKVVSAAHLRPE